MYNTIANLYELFIYDSQFSTSVYRDNDYVFLFFAFLFIPLIILGLFYRPIDPIPVKFWKWMLAVLISFTIVFAFSYYWLSSNSMYNDIMVGIQGAMSFTLLLCILSVVFSIIPTILFSWIFSRTISINNAKNPF